MKSLPLVLLAVLVAATVATPIAASAAPVVTRDVAPVPGAVGGGVGYLDTARRVPCLTEAERAEIVRELRAAREDLYARGLLPRPDKSRTVLMDWPLRAADHLRDPGYHGVSGFVDQDPAFPDQLRDYDCGTRTYDLSSGYNHAGTDYFTWPFSWLKMDNDEVEIVAGAPGVIIAKHDGNYDRNCGFGSGSWNAVYVQHADGSVAWYGHMKNGSTTGRAVGETVAAGEVLGIVGSSGSSTGPHLHLELHDDQWNPVDPYAGPCNALNAESWWTDQRPYYDSAVNAVSTNSAPPEWPSCPLQEIPHEQDVFEAGDLVYFLAYYRDQLQGQVSTYSILRPDESVWRTWTGALDVPFYPASYWWWSWTLPLDAQDGWWTFRVEYEGQTAEHRFGVGDHGPTDVPTPAGPALALRAAAPNPFNPTTEIVFALPAAGRAVLRIHDARGRRLSTLVDEELGPGEHAATWSGRGIDGRRVPAAVYFARLEFDGRARALKLTLSE